MFDESSIFRKKTSDVSSITLQSPLSVHEDRHIEEVRKKKTRQIIKYKSTCLSIKKTRRSNEANITDTFFFMLRQVIYCIEDKQLNAFELWKEFKNQESNKTEKNTLGVLVKLNSEYYQNLVVLENKINNNEFSLKIRYVSEFVRFVIYINQKYCS